jgi:cold shock CspA family protein
MIGRVKVFYEDKKFGFIVGEDNFEYFFHITNIVGVDLPTSNSIVEFEPTVAERGKKAINVKVTQKYEQKPQYINLGRTRIKVSSIKLYWTDKNVEKNYRDRGFWKTREYIGDTITYYIYIRTSKDNYYDYQLTYSDKTEFLAACRMLDTCLATVSL